MYVWGWGGGGFNRLDTFALRDASGVWSIIFEEILKIMIQFDTFIL